MSVPPIIILNLYKIFMKKKLYEQLSCWLSDALFFIILYSVNKDTWIYGINFLRSLESF